MTQEKAREFFSPYFEGLLEPGLAQALEHEFRRDPELKGEFQLFEQTYEELGKLKFATVEIPFDLHDRILARIDRQELEAKHAKPAWGAWLRTLAIGGVATAAIVGAVLSLKQTDSNSTSASVVRVSAPEEVWVTPVPGGAELRYSSSVPREVILRSGLDGAEIRRTEQSGELLSPIHNDSADPAVFGIEVAGRSGITLLALPGTKRVREGSGSGNFEEFSRALAGFYGSPVMVRVKNPAEQIRWNLKGLDSVAAASSTLDVQAYLVEKRPNGLLVILDQ